MITTSELVVSVTIWVMTATGCFFGLRAVIRRRKSKPPAERQAIPPEKP